MATASVSRPTPAGPWDTAKLCSRPSGPLCHISVMPALSYTIVPPRTLGETAATALSCAAPSGAQSNLEVRATRNCSIAAPARPKRASEALPRILVTAKPLM